MLVRIAKLITCLQSLHEVRPRVSKSTTVWLWWLMASWYHWMNDMQQIAIAIAALAVLPSQKQYATQQISWWVSLYFSWVWIDLVGLLWIGTLCCHRQRIFWYTAHAQPRISITISNEWTGYNTKAVHLSPTLTLSRNLHTSHVHAQSLTWFCTKNQL